MDFYSYMACRFADDDTFGHLRAHVKSGDKIVFENGACLEILETLYCFNGETNFFSSELGHSCIIQGTNVIHGAFISWFD